MDNEEKWLVEPGREQNWAWKRGGEGGISPAATPTPRDSPVPHAAGSGGWCKVLAVLQTSKARQGWEPGAEVKKCFGRLGACRESLTEPMYQSWPKLCPFETLPSPAVMHWHVTKKHSAGQRILAASCGHKILFNVGIHPVATVTKFH